MMKRLKYFTLAALVAFAACDEGTPPATPVVGSVTGTVTAEGSGVAGVTVTLAGTSSQSVTTGSDGSFSFSNVVEGTYSVSISGIPADYVFSSTTQTVTIDTDGQTATVSFTGSVVRTASISGQVTANGTGVEGVPVEISGPEGTESKQTGSAGNFSFTGLRSGDYTVTITNPDAERYNFPVTEQSVTLAVGESEIVNFGGTETLPGSISGMVTASGIGVEGATITIAGPETASKVTGVDGAYAFNNLDPGDYTVTLTNPDPDKYEFPVTEVMVTLESGEAEIVNFGGTLIAKPDVAIESITKNGVAIDHDNLSGTVEVTVNVRLNGATLTEVQLVAVDDDTGLAYRVGRQTFAEGAPPLEQQEDDAVDVVFQWQTDRTRNVLGEAPAAIPYTEDLFDLANNPFEPIEADAMRPYHPLFLNGGWQLYARAMSEESEPQNAIVDVTTVNDDAVNLGVQSDNSDWVMPGTDGEYFPNFIIDDDTGLRWLSGDVWVKVYPIIYSAPFDPKDPLLARAVFSFRGFRNGTDIMVGGGENFPPNEDGTFDFTFCEGGGLFDATVVATANDGESACYADIRQFNTGFIGARDITLLTKTKFGQFGPTIANLKTINFFDADLQSGTGVLNDILRVDNESPVPGYLTKLDHPANDYIGVSDFSRTGIGGTNNLGWVNWGDDLSDLFEGANCPSPVLRMCDAPYDVVGGPFTGPDNKTLNTGDDLIGIGLLSGIPFEIFIRGPNNPSASASSIISNADFTWFSGDDVTFTGDMLPPETEGPGLTDGCVENGGPGEPDAVCSEDGTPYSNTETDYGYAARHYDEFGNRVATANGEDEPGYLLLGVDGRAPIYSDATGTMVQAPADPTAAGTKYNTYDDDFYDLDLDNAPTFGNSVWNSTTTGVAPFNTGKAKGAYGGFTTDRGNGFSGVAGVVVHDWESRCATGSLACAPFDQMDTRWGYTLQPVVPNGSAVVLPFRFDGQTDTDPAGSDTFIDDGDPARIPVHVAGVPFRAYVATQDVADSDDGYRLHFMETWDRAGNPREDHSASEGIADHKMPDVGNVQMPTVVQFNLDDPYDFLGENLDNADLKKSDFSFDFNSILSLQVYASPAAASHPNQAGPIPPNDVDAQPYEETSLQLPLENVAHAPFGSASIYRGGNLSINTEFLGCLVRADEYGLASVASANTLGDADAVAEPHVHRPRGPRWRTWDHSSEYGLVNTQFNTFVPSSIPDCLTPAEIATNFVPALGQVGPGVDGVDNTADDGSGPDGIFGTQDDDAGWIFNLTPGGAPRITFKGPTATFVPNIDPNEDILVYYLDTAGRAQLLANSSFSLTVSDLGVGAYGRWFEYTLTNPIPSDLIDNANAPDNGTVGGWFFIVKGNGINGNSGHGVIWDTTANPPGVVTATALTTDGTILATPGANNGLFSFTAAEDEGYLVQANSADDVVLRVNPILGQVTVADGEFIGLSEHEFVGFVAPAMTDMSVFVGDANGDPATGEVNAQVCTVSQLTVNDAVPLTLTLDEATDCNVQPAGTALTGSVELNAQFVQVNLVAGQTYTFTLDVSTAAGDLDDPEAILLSPAGLPVTSTIGSGQGLNDDETFQYTVPAGMTGTYVLVVHGAATTLNDAGDVDVTVTN